MTNWLSGKKWGIAFNLLQMTPLVPVCWVRVAQSVGGADAFEGIFPGN